MKFRKAGTFAKAEGQPKTWKERLAGLKGAGRAKAKPSAKLEIDDATGETLSFPDIGDVSEILEGVTVVATDGDHVFTADASTYTVTVLDGVVTKVIEDQTGDDPDAEAMNAETLEFIEAVAEAMEANEQFRATAQASIDRLTADLATANTTISAIRATMSHKAPKEGEGDGGAGEGGVAAVLKINGKTIDLSKINLNSKK